MLSLPELLHCLPLVYSTTPIPEVEVTGVTDDSRTVQAGNLFVARGGSLTDGARHIGQAVSRGAVAVVSGDSIPDCPLPQVIVPDPAAAVSLLTNRFFGTPSEQVKTVGVTGTNGKTTTTYLIRHVLNHFNLRCGMVGTVEIDDGRSRYESTMTTPAATEVAQLLATMRGNGCRACAMETSSHSLHQGRVAGVRYAGAAFTNLTGDHLDYHKTMDEYAAAKARLFEGLDENAVAAVNTDDPWSERMVRNCRARIIRFGFGGGAGQKAEYRAMDMKITAAGSTFILHTPDGQAQIDLRLIGRHNIENALAAAALLGEVFTLNVHQLAAGFKDAAGAPGRLQAVRAGQPFTVLVDYAHTDDALRNVLTALRPLTRGRLRVLFGCGGDRDATKRPRMAKAAEQFADAIYVTSDNPRTEDPRKILDQIVAGFATEVQRPMVVEMDRRIAIQRILSDSEAGDIVLIAGKGHENYQIIGATKHHFDDVEECKKILGNRRSVTSAEVTAA
jgi:UDP-N-acetylmuramoyl-L-alanyl-D-glutamate--2,6-diaminopimelate ligase